MFTELNVLNKKKTKNKNDEPKTVLNHWGDVFVVKVKNLGQQRRLEALKDVTLMTNVQFLSITTFNQSL